MVKLFQLSGFVGVGLGASGLLALSARLNPNLGLTGVLIPLLILVLLLAFAFSDESLSKFLEVANDHILAGLIGAIACLIVGSVMQCLN